ncbi:MAG: hypothetical protein LBE01_05505 [Deltaproteobacteria bacterium]|nr:hypothetical protein [Deltaproteobacteria bacterium]
MKKFWRKSLDFFLAPIGETPSSPAAAHKKLAKVALNDPYGQGQPVEPGLAESLGAFEETAIAAEDFDPAFPSAMRDLLGEDE